MSAYIVDAMNKTSRLASKKILTINAPSGQLFGIQQTPANEVKLCIVMLNSGMLNRSGPQRLYWTFAQQACRENMAVVRIDLAGVGDSLAETTETHFDNHSKEDVNAVIDYVHSEWPDAKIVLQGLCAGSRVCFKTAAENPKVSGLLAWSTEIYTASQNMPQSPHEPEDRLSEYEVSDTLSRVVKFLVTFKFLRPSWWRKEYPNGEGLVDEIKHTVKCALKAVIKSNPENQGEFLVAADSYLKQNRPVYFAFGEYDNRALSEFESRFPQIKTDQKLTQSYRVISQGTHTFSTKDSSDDVIKSSLDWIKTHFH